jgi:hypothetical protein
MLNIGNGPSGLNEVLLVVDEPLNEVDDQQLLKRRTCKVAGLILLGAGFYAGAVATLISCDKGGIDSKCVILYLTLMGSAFGTFYVASRVLNRDHE